MKSLILSILALTSLAIFVAPVHAASQADMDAMEFSVNHGNVGSFAKWQMGTKLLKEKEVTQKCVYDFSVQGGAVGTLSLLDEVGKPCVLPKSAIIRDVLIDVVTAPTSGGSATIALGSGAATNDFKTATLYSSFSGLMAGIPVGSAATAIKLAADEDPSISIATAALTAGKLNVQIRYQLSE